MLPPMPSTTWATRPAAERRRRCEELGRGLHAAATAVPQPAASPALFDQVLDATLLACIEHLQREPVDRAVLLATVFEVDPDVRFEAAQALAPHLSALARLVVTAVADLASDVDADELVTLLVVLLPQLAIAPFAGQLQDPAAAASSSAVASARRMLATTARAMITGTPA